MVLPVLAAGIPGAGLPPLTAGRLLTSWTAPPAVLAGVAVLGGAYLAGVRRMHRAGLPWSARRTAPFLLGAALLLLVGTSVVAVYDDTLFWARAVQGVVLLVVAPMLLAAGAPLTLARETLPATAVGRLGRLRRSRVAHAVSSPGAATIALIAPPFLLYLTGLYPLELRSAVVSGLVSVGLLAAGLLYVVSRLQIDPVPRETHHGLTLGIAIAEVVTDGVLGLVLWTGPLLAVAHYDAVARTWGPTPRERPGDRRGRVVDRRGPRGPALPRGHRAALRGRGRPGGPPHRRRARRGGARAGGGRAGGARRRRATTAAPDRTPRRGRGSGGRTTPASPTASGGPSAPRRAHAS